MPVISTQVQGVRLNHALFYSESVPSYAMRRYWAMMLPRKDDRRCIMAIAVQQIRPVAHLPLVLGVLRRLEVASLIDDLILPHPAHVLSTGRGVDALVLAIMDGDHALYKVGQRLEERGLVALLQPGLTRAKKGEFVKFFDH